MPENIRVGQAQCPATPGQCFIKTFKGPAGRTVHERERHHCRSEDAAIPGHDKADAHIIEEHADGMFQAEDEEEQPAAYRRRKDQGQREDDIEDSL